VPAGTTEPRNILRQLDGVQSLLESLGRNPNVRLSLEQTLLTLS
jgi:hypothetical protein